MCDFLLEATEQAVALGRLAPEERGPLHGLPLSVKECFLVEGHDSNIGLASLIGRPSARDAPMVAMLKAQGALPFCLTNIPQTMVGDHTRQVTACAGQLWVQQPGVRGDEEPSMSGSYSWGFFWRRGGQ